MICDIHCHVVFGVDDGSQSIKTSIKMLKIASQQGVKKIVCTSHSTPGYHDLNLTRYFDHLEKLKEAAADAEIDVELLPGCEIMYTEATPQMLLDEKTLTLAGTNNVLIEFLPEAPFEMLKRSASDLCNSGFQPIFAHIERYEALSEIDRVRQLKEYYGVFMQMNARTALSAKGLFGNGWVKSALKEKLIDLIASDAHNTDDRKCVIGDAHKLIDDKYGEKYAKRLFETMPNKLLKLEDA